MWKRRPSSSMKTVVIDAADSVFMLAPVLRHPANESSRCGLDFSITTINQSGRSRPVNVKDLVTLSQPNSLCNTANRSTPLRC
jgi:hypothetical protein